MIRFLAASAVLVAALALTAPAQADITASGITTPKSPKFVLYTQRDTGIAIAGKATGVGNVDIVCEDASQVTVLAHDVPVAGDGKFSAPGTSLDPLIDTYSYAAGRTCRLRAVPAGTTPDHLTLFRGPVLAVSRYGRVAIEGGLNDGKLGNYYLSAAGVDRATDFGAFGAIGAGTVTLDPATLLPEDEDGYSAGSAVDASQIPLAGVKVDGVAAYSSGAAYFAPGGLGADGNPGFVALPPPTVRFDDATGAVDVSERTPFVKCGPDAVYPPTQFTCSQFDGVPVQMRRTTSVLAGDHVVRVVDRWSSTDGRAHRLDLTLSHWACCTRDHEYRFPGESGFTSHDADPATAATDTVDGPFRAGSPILARHAGGAGSGLIYLPLQSADRARFVAHDEFGLEYRNRTIPAAGELEFTHYYLTTRTAGELDAAAAKLVASLPKPKPPVSPPHGGGGPPVTPPAVPAFTRAGHVRVHHSGRTFRVITRDRVRCAAACVLAVHGKRIAAASTAVRAGRTAKVSFRLTRRGARTLLQRGRLRLAVTLSARIGAGPAVTATRRLTLRVKV
jgi:hypothetical protein